MEYPRTPNDLSPARRRTVIATLGALGTIAPFSIDLYLPALPAPGAALDASQPQVADMTVC